MRSNPVVRWTVAGGCLFEAGAILLSRWPTLSDLSRRHRWLAPLLLGALTLDLMVDPRPVVLTVLEEAP